MSPNFTRFHARMIPVFKLLLCMLIYSASIQTMHGQQLVNTTGNTVSTGNFFVEYSIGEIAITTVIDNTNHATQGLLQPIIKFAGDPCKVLDFVPTAFTPNSDGLNDCFGLRFWNPVLDFEFSIWNRWGEMIFKTNDLYACWDGKYKGTTQPIGVYVYMIKGTTLCGPTFKKGTFTLIK